MAINRDKVLAAAAKFSQSGKYDKAIHELQKLVDDDPKDVRTILKIGETYVKMGRRDEALQRYQHVATLYAAQGFFLKAVAVYKQMLRIDTNLPDVHLELAEMYQQLGLSSDCMQHYQWVALFYEQRGRSEESLHVLKKMVDLDPDNLPSRIKLAELFAQQGRSADAVEEFRSAANYLRQQERLDDYVRVAERLTYFNPAALDVTHELAEVYLRRGDPKAALGKLQVCFKADHRNLKTLELIAQAFLDTQQVAKSISVYKEMARIHTADGAPDSARGVWQRVLSLDSQDAEARAAVYGPERATAPQGGLPGAGLPGAGVPGAGLPGAGLPVAGLPGAGLPGAGLPGAGVPGAGVPAAAQAPPSAPVDEQLERMLTETDVYVKYGLRDKAVEHLQKIVASHPESIAAHEKLLGLYESMGNGGGVLSALRALVELAAGTGHASAESWRAKLENLSPAAVPDDSDVVDLDDRDVSVIESDIDFDDSVEALAVGVSPADSVPGPLDDDDDGAWLEAAEEALLMAEAESMLLDNAEPDREADPAIRQDDDGSADHDEALWGPTVRERSSYGKAGDPAPEISEDALSLDDADELVRQALADFDGLADGSEDEDEPLPTVAPEVDEEFDLDALPGGHFDDDFDLTPQALPVDDPLQEGVDALIMDAQVEAAPRDTAYEVRGPVDAGGVDDGAPDDFDEASDFDEATQMSAYAAEELVAMSRSALSGQSGVAPAVDQAEDHVEVGGSDALWRGPTLGAADAGLGEDEDSFDDATVAMAAPPIAHIRVSPASRASLLADDEEPALAPDAEPLPAAAMGADDYPDVTDAVHQVGRGALAAAAEPQAMTTELADARPDAVPSAASDAMPVDRPTAVDDDPALAFFADELAEADFFLGQGMLDEAQDLLESIREDAPHSPRLEWMFARLVARRAGEPEPEVPWQQDLLDAVTEGLDEFVEFAQTESVFDNSQVSVDEVLHQFRRGVAETIDENDAETHYNLGIAYREMGLSNDAVAEFRLAARAPTRQLDALHLIGVTLTDVGDHEAALEAFEEAASMPGARPDQRAMTEYQRGICFDALGRSEAACAAYAAAESLGCPMPDLAARLARAQQNNAGTAAVGSPRPRRKNIDYV